MAKELERAGIPVALISALPPLALQVGANRVVRGVRIEHVCGDPALAPEADRALSLQLVETALAALQASVGGPTLFEPGGPATQVHRASPGSAGVSPARGAPGSLPTEVQRAS